MKLSFEVGAKSVPGTGVRPNQDRFLDNTDSKERRMLFAVADGVTHSPSIDGDGGVAAQAVVSLLRDADHSLKLADAVREVHRKILEMKRHVPTIGETTLVAAEIIGDTVHVANVGDSPAHLIRDGRLRRLYRPDLGWSGSLSQAMGYGEHIKVHERTAKLFPGDILMLGSDGIMKHIKSYIWPTNPKECDRTEGMYITRTILTANEIRSIVDSNNASIAAEELLNMVTSKRPQDFDDKTVIVIRVKSS